MTTVLLLIFMTAAWYGHLKYKQAPLIGAIVVSWLIAFLEYCFQVPANRIGYGEFTAFQLKIIQEVIKLSVFVVSPGGILANTSAGTTRCRFFFRWAQSRSLSGASLSGYNEPAMEIL